MCFECGRKQMKASSTAACSHQRKSSSSPSRGPTGSSKPATRLDTGMAKAAGSSPWAMSAPCMPR